MVSKEEFDKAAEEVSALKNLSKDEMLEVYGWFKQATVGDCEQGESAVLHFTPPPTKNTQPDFIHHLRVGVIPDESVAQRGRAEGT